MRKIFILAALMLSACQTNGPKNIDRGDMSLAGVAPGTVIHQSSRELENGFYDVTKSVVNSAGHWEGIGHFGYVYHNKTEICQCSDGQTVRSPNGEYIVYFSNKRKQLELFHINSKKITVLSDEYIGYPETVEWDMKSKSAIIYLSEPNGTKNKELEIKLN